MSSYEQAHRSMQAGTLAEAAVLAVFGVKEPGVEIKACCRSWNRASIRIRQLEESYDKDFIFVIYDRRRCCRRNRKGVKKSKARITIEEAFRQPLDLIVIHGAKLTELIVRNSLPLRTIKQSGYYAARFMVRVPLGLVKAELDLTSRIDKHRHWGLVPVMPEVPVPEPETANAAPPF